MRDDLHFNRGQGPGHIDPAAGSRLPRGTFPPGRAESYLPAGMVSASTEPYMPPQSASPASPPATGVPAGFFRRAFAFMADLFLVEFMATLLGTMSTMGQMLSQGMDSPFSDGAEDMVILFAAQAFPLLLFCYFFFFYAYGGRTPGKMLFGLVVETAQGQPLSWTRALARTLCYLASVFTWGLGFLLAAGPAKKALHDRLAGTRVVYRNPREAGPRD